MNGGFEPQVRPRDVFGRKIARTRQGDGVEAAQSNAHSHALDARCYAPLLSAGATKQQRIKIFSKPPNFLI
jgi:hypothetical protein